MNELMAKNMEGGTGVFLWSLEEAPAAIMKESCCSIVDRETDPAVERVAAIEVTQNLRAVIVSRGGLSN